MEPQKSDRGVRNLSPRRHPYDPRDPQRNRFPNILNIPNIQSQRPDTHRPGHRPLTTSLHLPLTNQPCIHFYSYGQTVNEIPPFTIPVIAHIQCKHLEAPSVQLCKQYTGLSPLLSASFFSYPENATVYRKNIDGLLVQLRKEKRVGCLAVAVSCHWGRHRSVAMAEKMAGRVAKEGWKVMIAHIDLLEEEESFMRESSGREGRKGVRWADEEKGERKGRKIRVVVID